MLEPEPHHQPRRLLYIRDTLTICGPGKTILNTWRLLDPSRYLVTIVATRPAATERNGLLDAARRLGARTHELAIGRGIDLVAVSQLVRLIKSERIDILQTHDAQTRRIGMLAAALTGTLHVSSVHGWIFNDRKELVARWIDRRLLRMADAVIAVSDRLRQDLIGAGVAEERVTLLRNAVVLQDYAASATRDASEMRRELGLPLDAPVVSIIGRLSKEKGHEDFLQAAKMVVQSVPAAKFLIVGDGPLRDVLARRIGELGLGSSVLLTGHREDLANLYTLTDVLAISSYTEGIPNVLLEAFAYSTPAVATAVGGVPEVLDHERTGYLVSPGQPAELAGRLVMLLRDPRLRNEMGRRARQIVEERFNFVERTRALDRLYANLPRGANKVKQ